MRLTNGDWDPVTQRNVAASGGGRSVRPRSVVPVRITGTVDSRFGPVNTFSKNGLTNWTARTPHSRTFPDTMPQLERTTAVRLVRMAADLVSVQREALDCYSATSRMRVKAAERYLLRRSADRGKVLVATNAHRGEEIPLVADAPGGMTIYPLYGGMLASFT